MALDNLWLHLEEVAIDFVHFLLAHILQVVFRKLRGGERKRGDALKAFQIFRAEEEMLERRTRPLHDLFVELPIRVAEGLRDHHKFARWLSVLAEFLDANGLPVGVVRARGKVFIFLLRKALDDLGLGKRRRRLRLGHIPDARNVMLRRGRNGTLRRILGKERQSLCSPRSQ